MPDGRMMRELLIAGCLTLLLPVGTQAQVVLDSPAPASASEQVRGLSDVMVESRGPFAALPPNTRTRCCSLKGALIGAGIGRAGNCSDEKPVRRWRLHGGLHQGRACPWRDRCGFGSPGPSKPQMVHALAPRVDSLHFTSHLRPSAWSDGRSAILNSVQKE